MKLTALIKVIFTVLIIGNTALAMPFAPIPVVPDQEITPGDFCDTKDKDFKEYRYPEKMVYCERSVSKSVKTRIYAAYNVPLKCKHRYTVDHFVPLALGGNNSDQNLWPEHVLVKATRQKLEQELYEQVSKGEMKSEDAVQILMEEKTKLNLDLSHVDGCG